MRDERGRGARAGMGLEGAALGARTWSLLRRPQLRFELYTCVVVGVARMRGPWGQGPPPLLPWQPGGHGGRRTAATRLARH